MSYSYEIPDNSVFVGNLCVNMPEIAELIQQVVVTFEDKGNAYYYDKQRHGWDRNALVIKFTGAERAIHALSATNQRVFKSKCESLLPENSGFDVSFDYVIAVQGFQQFQTVPNALEREIARISTRGAEFDSMAIDERLAELNNLIENLLKRGRRYISPNYEEIFFGFLDEDDVKSFRQRTQCFRHASEAMLSERLAMTNEEKRLLCDIGIFICIHLYQHLNEIEP